MTEMLSGDSELRWQQLLEAKTLGEDWSGEREKELRSLAEQDPVRARELSVLDALEDPGAAEPKDEAFIELVIQEHGRAGRRKRWMGWAAAAAVIVGVCGLALSERDVAAPTAAAWLPVQVQLIAGESDARAAGRILKPGERFEATHGKACLYAQPRARVCLARGAVVQLIESTERQRTLTLKRGTAAFDLGPQPKGSQFSVQTRHGRVTAIGTQFLVTTQAETSSVALAEGIIAVSPVGDGKTDVRLEAPAQLRFAAGSSEQRAHLTQDEREELRSLLGGSQLWSHGPYAILNLDVSPKDATVTLSRSATDVVRLTPLPLAVLLDPGTWTLHAELDQHETVQRQLRLDAGDTKKLNVSLRVSDEPAQADVEALSNDPAGPAASAPPQLGSTASAAELLRAAQAARSASEYDQAASLYRRLIAAYPESKPAHLAQISLGQLDLSRGHPQSALKQFDAYLARGGSLSQEALYGRIMALRSLKRGADERAAIERFVRSYPESPHATALRKRLKQL